MKEKLLNRIEINPIIVFSKTVIKGTWYAVETILEKLHRQGGIGKRC